MMVLKYKVNFNSQLQSNDYLENDFSTTKGISINIKINNNNKKIKPFSIFSLATNTQSKVNPRLSMIQESKEHKKEKSKKINREHHKPHNNENKVENNEKQNTYRQEQFENKLTFKLNSSENLQENTIFNQINLKSDQFFDDSVIFKSEKIALDNITNQIIKESLEKPIFLEKNKFQDEQQCSLDRSFEELKEKKICVDLKKKIKKLPKGFRFPLKTSSFSHEIDLQNDLSFEDFDERQLIALKHRQFLNNPYADNQVVVDNPIYQNRLISQRIDNDVDSEDEQITAGMGRMQKSLQEAVELNKIRQVEFKYLF